MDPQYNNDNFAKEIWDESKRERPRISFGKFAVVLIILGLCLFGAGWVSGARGGRVYLTGGFRVVPYSSGQIEGHTAVDMTAANTIHSLAVTATSSAVQLVPTTSDRLTITSSNRGITTSETDGRLYVNVQSAGTNISFLGTPNLGVSMNVSRGNDTFLDFNFNRRSLNFRNLSSTVRVYVPESVNDIYARTRSGSIRINDVSTNEIRLHANSGSVHLSGGNHRHAHMQTSSGSVRANGHFSGNITGISNSGSVRIDDYSTSHTGNSINLEARSGSVRFYTNAPRTDFSYNLSVRSGSMRIDGNRISGRDHSGGSGSTQIDASTRSGSVQMNFGR